MLMVNQLIGFGAAAAAGTWVTSYAATLNADTSHGVSRTSTTAIVAGDMAQSGTKFRITFRGPGSGSTSVNEIWAGHGSGGADDFDGTQVQVTIGGSAGPFTFNTDTDYLSDEINYSVDETKEFVVSYYHGATTMRIQSDGNCRGYEQSGNVASTTNKAGSEVSGLGRRNINGVKLIEVFVV